MVDTVTQETRLLAPLWYHCCIIDLPNYGDCNPNNNTINNLKVNEYTSESNDSDDNIIEKEKERKRACHWWILYSAVINSN